MHSLTASRKSLAFINSQVVNASNPSNSTVPGVEVVFLSATSTQQRMRRRKLQERLPDPSMIPVPTSFVTEMPEACN